MLTEKQVKKTTLNLIDRLKNLESLRAIAYKLINPEEGEGWTKKQTEAAIANYLRFLLLKREYPNAEIVPSQEIDRVWHLHILDTLNYAADCQAVFGQFIHHFPYFGIRGKGDRASLEATFTRTQALFKEHFSVSLGRSSVCVIPHKKEQVQPSVCVIPSNVDTFRPRVDIDLDSYFPTEFKSV